MSDNITQFPRSRRMRPFAAVIQNVFSAIPPSNATLANMHDAAEAFHCAMARAHRLADDLESIKKDLREYSFRSEFAGHDDEIADLERRYRDALTEATMALEKMPARWAAVLGSELPTTPGAA